MHDSVIPELATRNRVSAAVLLLLGVAWCGALVGLVFDSDRHSNLGTLEEAIAAGDVDTVGVVDDLGEGARGFATPELHWSRGGLNYYTDVTQRSGTGRRNGQFGFDSNQTSPAGSREATGLIVGDVATYLRKHNAALRVVPADRVDTSVVIKVAGWRVTGRLLFLYVALLVLTASVISVGREPRQATRWAWFWLIFLLGPVTAPFYCFREARNLGERHAVNPTRLTGGWSLLLCLAVGALVTG